MKIRVLASEVSDQIAAGEVVERPASVVKELVENSLDAGGVNIDVFVEGGGKRVLEVRDDGVGMSREDAEMCTARHATSKIREIDDLFAVQHFGFRGEALAAISAVSRFSLLTRRDEDDEGVRVEVVAGKRGDVAVAPMNVGTQIRVEDLFFPVPVRLKYLKTDETEYRAVFKEVINFALSHPDAAFRLFRDGKLMLDFSAGVGFDARVQRVLKLGQDALLEVSGVYGGVKISGFVCRPDLAVKTKAHQYLFVNRRRIEDFRLSFAVRDSFLQSCGIEKHLHPAFVLFLKMDPILVDVNVHPRKLEVKFAEPGDVFSAVKNVVVGALEKGSDFGVNRVAVENSSAFKSFSENKFATGSGVNSFKKIADGKKFTDSLFGENSGFAGRNDVRDCLENGEKSVSEVCDFGVEKKCDGGLRLLGQLKNRYILAEGEDGLFVFDQHALHERQRFERFLVECEKKDVGVQKLLLPEVVNLSEVERSAVWENSVFLFGLGFELDFGDDASVVEVLAVPVLLVGENLVGLFQDFAAYFEDGGVGEHCVERFLREVLERRSCRGAVMFGDKLSEEEMQGLLDDFVSTKWRLLCPHGRPNHVFFGDGDLEGMFHR